MNNLEGIIQKQISSIDISETAYKQAEERYQAIGKWLQRDDSQLARFSPDVYTQGSFALGTVIRPLDESEDYDIDLVCHLKTEKSNHTQKEIKEILGEEVKKYANENDMSNTPEEGRRCWTMIYASSNSSAGFHLDALPSISSWSYTEAKKKYEWYERDKQTNVFQINITDNEKENYEKISNDWNVSNPKGYAKWFNLKQQTAIARASGISAKTENVPSYHIKTPLQKAIQFLKRHRDIYFQGDSEVKPISIIITTLVAQTYDEKHSNVVDIIECFIKTHHLYIEDNDFISNPVNPKENFADKWAEYPERKEAFCTWVKQLKTDFENLINLLDEPASDHVRKILKKSKHNDLYQRSTRNLPAIDFNVKHKKVLSFPIASNNYKVTITAKYCKKGFISKLLRSGEGIAKNYSITFKVHAKNIRGKKKYYWQVVNTGDEAIKINNDPRGGFYDGEAKRGGKTRVETTSYKGTHWVQCFIVQNDKCIAKSPEFIVEIK